ncbi:MAG: sodium/glutamate symporter, partial [Cellvibrionales bacterium]|nr:sodium/glutamate symporter [Cellvibrionales bacterium]
MALSIGGINFLILSIIAIFIGARINHYFTFLEKSNIPKAVTGGLVFSALFGIFESFHWLSLDFNMELRNVLLLVFFASVGLSAKIKVLMAGGKSLILLLIPAVILLIIQNVTGVSICHLFGDEPVHGLFAGSIPLAGGHGTAIAWGQEATRQGFMYAESIGISFATFGLVLGGLVGCPLATWLIHRHQLQPNHQPTEKELAAVHIPNMQLLPSLDDMLKALLMVSIAVSLGVYLNEYLVTSGILLPNFVVVMLVAI